MQALVKNMKVKECLKHWHYFLILAALTFSPLWASTTSITDPGAGNGSERCVSDGAGSGGTCNATIGGSSNVYGGLDSMIQLFADSQDATLTRVDDSMDQLWTAGAGARVFGLARSAGRNFTLGELAGASGNAYTMLLNTIGSAASPVVFLASIPAGQDGNSDLQVSGYDGNGLPIFTSVSPGTFRFAIQCAPGCAPAGQTRSSLPSDNSDGEDHLVTWQLTGGKRTSGDIWYVAVFENGTDFDFNDYVFVFQNVTPGPDTPEPGSAILVAGTLLLAMVLRRKLYRLS